MSRVKEPAKNGKLPRKTVKDAVRKVTEKKTIQVGFSDNRNKELREKLEQTIYDYAPQAGMTYAAVIGVLQMLIFDIYGNSVREEE